MCIHIHIYIFNRHQPATVAFSQFDINSDGAVSREEMINYFKKFFSAKDALSGLGTSSQTRWVAIEQHLNRCSDGVKLDKNGTINFEEFKREILNPDHPIGMVFSMYVN